MTFETAADHDPKSSAVQTLVLSLKAWGLATTVTRHGTIWVRNPASAPVGDDPPEPALKAGLRQEVRCDQRADGELWWFWVWAGMTRQSPPDLEPLCPIDDPERAAERIAKVLATDTS